MKHNSTPCFSVNETWYLQIQKIFNLRFSSEEESDKIFFQICQCQKVEKTDPKKKTAVLWTAACWFLLYWGNQLLKLKMHDTILWWYETGSKSLISSCSAAVVAVLSVALVPHTNLTNALATVELDSHK